MEIRLIGSTNMFSEPSVLSRFGQTCGRICYSEFDFDRLDKEPRNEGVLRRVLENGHHSVFDHTALHFYMKDIPKALVMVLNNERAYTTSEKSARFTKMKCIEPGQKMLYDRWMVHLRPLIDDVYPEMDDAKKRGENIDKLCQENARYMTSVFTPTKMMHSVSWRQINFIIHEFERFVDEHNFGKDEYKRRLALSMKDFLAQPDVAGLKYEHLENQTDRHLTFFRERAVEKFFGDTYSRSYLMSFAGLGQAHRHRTLTYNVSDGYQLGAELGFFVPEIIKGNEKLAEEWERDLRAVSREDFPQAQLLVVNERGTSEDFRSKCILRLCGQAQHEIMRNTLETAEEYADYKPEIKLWMKPKCMQGMKCNERCVWGGKKALERRI